jgi:hypothetical protein
MVGQILLVTYHQLIFSQFPEISDSISLNNFIASITQNIPFIVFFYLNKHWFIRRRLSIKSSNDWSFIVYLVSTTGTSTTVATGAAT